MKLWVLMGLVVVRRGNGQQEMSNIGHIVLEQDPRQQDPFYRNYYARADGMPLAAVNSVVHNVKHQSEGRFQIWDDLPSHRVRPGYTTTTKAPKIKTTTAPWVRGRPRSGGSHGQPPWFQKFSDAEGYDTGGQGSDYDEGAGAPPPRPRERRPPGAGRPRRPPAPMAPVRVNVGKGEELVDNGEGSAVGEGGGGDFAGDGEGTRTEAGTANEDSGGMKKPVMTTTTTTVKPVEKVEKKKKKEEDEEGKKKEEGGNEEEEEKDAGIDLADLKNAGSVSLQKDGKMGEKTGDKEEKEEKEEEDDDEEEKKASKKKKGKKKDDDEEEDEEDEEKDGTVKGKKEEKKKKKKKTEDDDKKKDKDKKKGSKQDDEDEEENEDDEEDEEDKNGKLKEVDGDVKIPKAVDGDTDKDDKEEDEEDDDEDDEDEEKETKKKKKGKRKRRKKKEEEEEDYDEEDEEEEEEDEDETKESMKKNEKGGRRKGKPSCRPSQRQELHQGHQGQYQKPHQTNPIPHNQVPYPDAWGYTMPTTTPMTTTTGRGHGDDYHDFEVMDCGNEDDEDEEEEEEEEKKKSKKKKKKPKKDKKKKKKKKGGKHLSLDYLTSREKVDQNKRNRGHILDELHADQDLKKLRKTEKQKPPDSVIDCLTAVDEFPLKCGAWKNAGFCDTNQATQFLWCRKTCLCSTTTTTSSTA